MYAIVFQRLAFQFVLDIALFPIWWYTGGLIRVLKGLVHNLADANMVLAPGLWIRNLFVPMYGQRDIGGRVMSIFMRLVNVIARFVALVVWMVILFVVLLCWIVLPAFLLYMFVRSLGLV